MEVRRRVARCPMAIEQPSESFPALRRLAGIRHAFFQRVPGLDVHTNRDEALARLAGHHAEARLGLGFPAGPIATAQQVHGNRVAVLAEPVTQEAPESDGLVTNLPGLCLGIYVADVAPFTSPTL